MKSKREYVHISSSRKRTPYMQYIHIPVIDAKHTRDFPPLNHLVYHPFLLIPQRRRLVGPVEDVAAV
jgi:hypothetical protein